jgi:hypothetical protein
MELHRCLNGYAFGQFLPRIREGFFWARFIHCMIHSLEQEEHPAYYLKR